LPLGREARLPLGQARKIGARRNPWVFFRFPAILRNPASAFLLATTSIQK
jgi:hypothetical protein